MSAPQPPLDAYATFFGFIDQRSIQYIVQHLTGATRPDANIARVHILFQSYGGTVGDGICLYNFFRHFPTDLIVYNSGTVESIGVIAYLGAAKRVASPRATFLLHRTSGPAQSLNAIAMQTALASIMLDDARTEKILRSHLKLTERQWSDLSRGLDVTLAAEDAAHCGLVDELGEFQPPTGSQLYSLNENPNPAERK